MTVELKKGLCEDEATEFIERSEISMCIQFSELVAHDRYEFCDRQKNDFES